MNLICEMILYVEMIYVFSGFDLLPGVVGPIVGEAVRGVCLETYAVNK